MQIAIHWQRCNPPLVFKQDAEVWAFGTMMVGVTAMDRTRIGHFRSRQWNEPNVEMLKATIAGMSYLQAMPKAAQNWLLAVEGLDERVRLSAPVFVTQATAEENHRQAWSAYQTMQRDVSFHLQSFRSKDGHLVVSAQGRCGTVFPVAAEQYVQSEPFDCVRCKQHLQIGASAARYVLGHGWRCGPCCDNMVETGEVPDWIFGW